MTVNVNEVYNPEKETEPPQPQQQELQLQECDVKLQVQGECDDTDDHGYPDQRDTGVVLGVRYRVAVVAVWWLAVVVILASTGCTLLRWGDNPSSLDNVTPVITVLKVDVPRVDITFGWSDGTFLLRNGGIVAGLVGVGVTLLVILSFMALRARRINDRP